MNEYTSTAMNVDLWAKHFKLMAQGKIKPNKHQVFIVDKTADIPTESRGTDKAMHLKMVTPAAQALEIATSDIKNADAAATDADPISHFPGEHQERPYPRKRPTPTNRKRPAKTVQNKVSNTDSKKKKSGKTPKQWQQYLKF